MNSTNDISGENLNFVEEIDMTRVKAFERLQRLSQNQLALHILLYTRACKTRG